MGGKYNKRMIRKLFFYGAGLTAVYFVLEAVAKWSTESRSIDDDNPYLENDFINTMSVSFYEKKIKNVLDRAVSFGGLLILSPVYLIIGLAVYIDDPGPVLFRQKRIGKNKHFFILHKYRSMKQDSPGDIPTHQLREPEQYLTRTGKVLRKTSLDELPQIWDVFRGKMSLIGPRPALWNQEDLIAERDQYGANDILPGLTGLAQINGRDELEIAQKARMDGVYTDILHAGGLRACYSDAMCFIKTIGKVFCHDGIVEGGTGRQKQITNQNYSVNEVYRLSGFPVRNGGQPSHIPARVLIAGSGSYIGTNIERFLNRFEEYRTDTVDVVGKVPEKKIFEGYDVLIFVAGIVHQKETKKNMRLYYDVNRDLAVQTALEAKKAGVSYFINFSSMSVYGRESGHITKDTKPAPQNHYGKSKLQADVGIWDLRDQKFRVAILRPPMVYGNGCKGNYQLLRKLALAIPVFPYTDNQRSMIYIGNLCMFVKEIIDGRCEGIFFPQNEEYVNTGFLVERIAVTNGKRLRRIRVFDPQIKRLHFNIMKKMFGSLTYEKEDIVHGYRLDDSLAMTESRLV